MPTCIASGLAVDVAILGEVICPACHRSFPTDCHFVSVLPVHPIPDPVREEAHHDAA